MERRYRWLTAATGAVIVGLSAGVAALGDLTRALPAFLVAFAGMHVAYLFSVYFFSRLTASRRSTLALAFAVAVAGRLVGLGASPSLSDDAYRYVWEGRVLRAGFSPYAHAPDSAALEQLRDANYERINHKNLPTIYPPAAQGAFFIGAWIGSNVAAQKCIFVLFDLATMVVLALYLRARGGNPIQCAVYGWNPLVIVEFAHSGHMDSLAVFFLVAAVFLLQKSRHLAGVAAMALSFLAKYFALALLPFLVFRRRYLPWGALFVGLCVVGYLPFAEAGARVTGSLDVYRRHWHFNSLVFETARRFADPAWTRWALVAVLIGVALRQGYLKRDLLRYTYVVVGCALVLSPTVYPWYACWMVPFLCFYASRAWLYLSGAIVLSYTVWPRFIESGEWRVSWAVLLVEYVPFFALLLYDGYRAARERESRWIDGA
jgi:hypothetical protein